MVNTRRVARLGMLAMGLGVGAAVASTPGIASADGLDFQISIDGQDLFPTIGNTATATSTMGNIAIAFGDNATATNGTGIGNFAFADGTNAFAGAGGGNFNTAVDIGNNSGPGELVLAGSGNNDFAFVEANNSTANAGGDLIDTAVRGNNDTSFIINPFGAGGDTVFTGDSFGTPGNNDFGGILFVDNDSNGHAAGADNLFYVDTPSGPITSPAAAGEAVGAASAAPVVDNPFTDLQDVVGLGQSDLTTGLGLLGSGDTAEGLAWTFAGIDNLTLGVGNTLQLDTVDLLTTGNDFGSWAFKPLEVPADFADALTDVQTALSQAQADFATAATDFAHGGILDGLVNVDDGFANGAVFPFEILTLAGAESLGSM